jgi:hypothetical protein
MKKKGAPDETLKKTSRKGGKKPPKGSDTIKKEKPAYKPKYANQFREAYTDEEIHTIADEMLSFIKKTKTAFHITSFATHKMIRRQTLYDFAKKNTYFAECFAIVKDILIDRSVKHGFTKGNNVTFPIFNLVNISEGEYKNKQEVNHSGSLSLGSIDTSKLTDEQLKTLRHKIQNKEDKENIIAYLKVIGAL